MIKVSDRLNSLLPERNLLFFAAQTRLGKPTNYGARLIRFETSSLYLLTYSSFNQLYKFIVLMLALNYISSRKRKIFWLAKPFCSLLD